MWLTASAWPVDISAADGLAPYANSVRVDTDVECYCDTVSSWNSSVSARWNDLPQWLSHVNGGYRPDLDSMPINNNTGTGVQDGLNDDERQSVMNFWSMASAPLYVGGDIYFMDSRAISILSNPEVIAVDQSSVNPSQVTGGNAQVWTKVIGSSTYVAVYNMGSAARTSRSTGTASACPARRTCATWTPGPISAPSTAAGPRRTCRRTARG